MDGTCQAAFGCPAGDVFPLDFDCDACLDSNVPRKISRVFDRAARAFERTRLRKSRVLLSKAGVKLDRVYERTTRVSDACYHATATAPLAAADRAAASSPSGASLGD